MLGNGHLKNYYLKKMSDLAKEFIQLSKEIYSEKYIPLHRPVFKGNEKKYLIDCIDSNFVSSVGKNVDKFEKMVAEYTNSKYAVSCVNGTSALHISNILAGVKQNNDVITQSLTFIATCNAISYSGANPIFVDVDRETLGMSPKALKKFLSKNAVKKDGSVFNNITGNRIAACIPMHTFGFPCRIKEIAEICFDWGIPLIEDAAESLGSFVNEIHTGNFGIMGVLSFNGNKLITTGGGGMIITNNEEIAINAKHLTTTAKVPHDYEFIHDQIGYNYRMPNINASLGCAQMENLSNFLDEKLKVTKRWKEFFNEWGVHFLQPDDGNRSNFWLNTIILDSKEQRDNFLEFTNKNGVMTRPIWTLMSKLDMYKDFYNDGLENSLWLEDRVVNIPSSVPSDFNEVQN